MAKYEMKYMYDWGSGTCVWSTNEAATEKYDYPVDIEVLPISESLKSLLHKLVEKHDEALNWDDPAGELLWDEKQQREFIETAEDAYYKLVEELDDEYALELWKDLI